MKDVDLLVVGSGAAGFSAAGRPIEGLYAAGNGMTGAMGGGYASAGMPIGPTLTFGYIAALHAASAAS